ncbi:hypothetical protein [Lysobacter gummosus]
MAIAAFSRRSRRRRIVRSGFLAGFNGIPAVGLERTFPKLGFAEDVC